MPILASGFREKNFKRIDQLYKTGFSPQTIASVIRDETGGDVKLTPADIRSYLKIQGAGSKRMLVTKSTMKALLKEGQSLEVMNA
ncbi:hypothetical protein [Pseudomonas mosselii]|uniref:hypothetical protein n=1 Tax=Pseudomonas mosselii TaxID=78327 RepID=UPI001E2BB8E0|nr:hypothetical protein [Pseudomonas mosselii]MCL8300882.1 hypothetical protein [Pseudomonas mosselii]MCL8341222.1 hypothetical protein [Pseudomonas mosselii]WJR28447.1 hypothetical protein LU678_029655 [Pseudomonas mosselii]